MKPSFRNEWPMDSYISSWKLFRHMSDENTQTARHILTRDSWPKHNDISILDIGCGDGLLIKQIITKSKDAISKVYLLDPDQELINQAHLHVTEISIVDNVHVFLNKIEEKVPDCYENVDVILAVHVAYLLPENSFIEMINKLPLKIPIYIVLDNPNSIFTKIWKHTAKKYYSRSTKSHKIIKGLPSYKFDVKESSINSCLSNPLSSHRENIKDSILSILCYADVRDMTIQEKSRVEKEIARVVVDDKVICESACYEIIRKR